MKNDQATLLILTPGFPKNEADTSCLTSQQNLVKAIKDKFPAINIIILSLQYPFEKRIYFWHGIKVIAMNGRNRATIFRLLLWRKVRRQLKTLYRENSVIGLLSFWCGECALLGNRFAKRYGLKHYCWILGQDAKKENRYVKRIHPPAGELIAMSEFLADEFYSNHLIRPAMVIPNGIDTGSFPENNTHRDIDILGVGSLTRLKQYDVFIRIIRDVKLHFPKIKAVICGGGPEEYHLERMIVDLGLTNTVSLVGELPHPGVLQLMQRSKILLHTSAYEGFSTVCLEALYAGCNVVSFVKPMKEDIEHWDIAKTKEEMLQKCIVVLQNNPVANDPVSPYLIKDSAGAIMKLFGYQ